MLPQNVVFLIPNRSSLSYTMPPLRAEVKCLIQRLVPPRTCAQYGNNAATALNSCSKFLHIHSSVHSHLWPSNSLFLGVPSLSLLCGFLYLCPIQNINISQGFVLVPLFFPMSSLLLGTLTASYSFNYYLYTKDFHTCISGPHSSLTSESFVQPPVIHLYLEISQEVQNQHVQNSSTSSSNLFFFL